MVSRRGYFFSALAGLIIGVMLVAVLPAGADNGDPIYLGQANIAKSTTRISVNYGMVIRSFRADVPAATFKVSSGAPIAVNSTGWVENLNADLLDGMQAAAFSTDGHPHAWSDLTSGVPAGLADGDDDALGGLACAAGQVAKRNLGDTAWECAEDDDTTYTDPEAVAAILGADGPGSGLDADLLDGSDSTDFADSAQRCPYGWTAAGFDTDGGIHCGGMVTLDETGDVGSDPSLVLDALGYPVIAYGGGGNLKLARCHDAYCMSFTVKTVDSDPLTHRWQSLALDASGYPVISYYDDTDHILKLAHCSDATCTAPATITTVDDSGTDMGAHNSMVLDASGYPVIAYTDYTNFNLKVAHCDDANCVSKSLETAATGTFTGEYTSIALDGSGYPIIAYYHDQVTNSLRVAHCVDADCAGAATINVVETGVLVGQYASMVLDALGYPVISYSGGGDDDLMLAHCSDADCSGTVTVNIVASEESLGIYSSVVLDASGFPMIVYRDTTDDEMELAVCGDANCALVTIYQIDTRPGSGMGTSMALLNGFPVIAHYDFTGGDLEIVFP